MDMVNYQKIFGKRFDVAQVLWETKEICGGDRGTQTILLAVTVRKLALEVDELKAKIAEMQKAMGQKEWRA
jgi:hypothetical protein